MRVLFLTKYTAGGPSSRYRVLQFLPFLEARGVESTVHALHDDSYLAARYAGGKTSPLYLARRTLSRLSVLASAPRYDLVFIQKEMFPHLIDLPEWFLSRAGVRYVVDIDDAIHLMYVNSRSMLRGKMARVLSRRVSRPGREPLPRGIRAPLQRTCALLPTVVDTRRFAPRVTAPDSAAAKDAQTLVVGWMGTPETVKYLDAMVPAMETAAERTRPFASCRRRTRAADARPLREGEGMVGI